MNNIYKNINEVAQLFKIPKHTLLYWEKEELLHFERNPLNNYRFATAETIFEIETVLHLRALDVPIESIRNMKRGSLKTQREIYLQAVQRAEMKIRDLEQICTLSRQMSFQIEQVEMLRTKPYQNETPPFTAIINHSDAVREAGSTAPGRFVLYFSKEKNYSMAEAFVDECADKDQILWQRQEKCRCWKTFLLQVEVVGGQRIASDFVEHMKELNRRGFLCGDVIAQYYAEEASPHGIHVYYKAYAEVKNTFN